MHGMPCARMRCSSSSWAGESTGQLPDACIATAGTAALHGSSVCVDRSSPARLLSGYPTGHAPSYLEGCLPDKQYVHDSWSWGHCTHSVFILYQSTAVHQLSYKHTHGPMGC